MLEDKLIDQLILHEGMVLKPYRDTVGKLTIGVGRNLDDLGISKDEAKILLKNDISRTMSEANKLSFFGKLSENRKLVILDMIFNMGFKTFSTFKNTIQLISDGKYTEASKAMLASKWASQVGKRAITLANMMDKG